MITDEEVYQQVTFLSSCYLNLKWDGVMTAGAWATVLQENNVELEELQKAIKWVVNNGIEEHRICIALIIDLILDDRKIKQREIKSKEHIKKLEEVQRISKEKFEEYKNKLFRELNIGGEDEKKV